MSLKGGQWHNEFPLPLVDTGRRTQGWPWYRQRPVYEYTARDIMPMTFQCGPACFVQPDKHFFTDLLSIPEFLQIFLGKDAHNPTAVIHDSACTHHGLYYSSTLDGVYTFCTISYTSAAELLGQCLYAAGYTVRAYPAWRAVRRFGPRW